MKDFISTTIENYIKNNQGIYGLESYICTNDIKDEFYTICNYLGTLDCDTIIGLYITKDYKYLLSILACMYMGQTYVPLNKKFPKDRNQQIIDIAEVDFVLTDTDEVDYKFTNLSKLKKNTNIVEIFKNDLNKPLYYIFTSGSTGEPKGVMIPRIGFETYIKWMSSSYEVNSNDRFLSFAEFTFDISFVDIGLLISKNIQFYFSRFNGNIVTMMQEIEQYNINVLSSVPTNFTLMLSSPLYQRFNIKPFKIIILGGAKTTKKLYELLLNQYPETIIHNAYGPTEATVYITNKEFDKTNNDFDGNNASVGEIREDAKVIIVDDNLNLIDEGNVGEVLVSGKQILLGYKGNEKKTKEVLVYIDDILYYRIGDLGYVKNNNLYIVGRVDDTIKTRGYRVNLSDIESYTHKIEYINESVVIAIEDENIENKLYLFVTLHKQTTDKNQIFNDLKTILPDYQMPTDIIIVDRMPLNNSGKISKIELKKIVNQSIPNTKNNS
jgi:D-alanine--poly(phosphoribitol) ligase subunit 1